MSDIQDLVHLEQSFYDAGYTDGFAHGRIHGLIQGRALGRDKGFEIWEELGFYQGFATTCKALSVSDSDSAQRPNPNPQPLPRALHHITHLLDLVRQFPTVNPTADPGPSDEMEVDMSKLLRQIRSRYKALCASLGVRPSLRAGPALGGVDDLDNVDAGDERERGQAQARGHLPNVRNSKRPVWQLESDVRRPIAQGLSF